MSRTENEEKTSHSRRNPPAGPDDYSASQALGARLRNQHGSDGVVYPSVRWPRGQALAAFWPDRVSIPVQGRHLAYRWNGERCDAYFVYGEDEWVAWPGAW